MRVTRKHLLIGVSLAASLACGGALAFPMSQQPAANSNAAVEKIGCWTAYGGWGPHRVCDDEDYQPPHYDFHPGGWQPHGDHYDWRPSHWDFHHNGHRHHLDEDE